MISLFTVPVASLMDPSMANLSLSHDEDDELVLDEGLISTSNTSVELCLVGRFLTDQPLNFNLMKSRMASIWRPGKGMFVKEIGQRRYVFQFFHPVDLRRIYEGGPWSFGNHPLILHHLKNGEFPLRVPLDFINFWVQVHDLPVGYITEGLGRQLGNFIGQFLEYDSTNSGSVWRQYMRIRVAINVNNPLKRCKRIKKPDGTSFIVNFKYEKLHIFCFVCGRLGHSESFCEDLFTRSQEDIKKEWGPWLKAADRRGQALGGDKWLRTENGTNVESDNRSASPETEVRRGKGIFEFGKPNLSARNQQSISSSDMANRAPEKELIKMHVNNAADTFSLNNDLRLHENFIFDADSLQMHTGIYNNTLHEDKKRRRENSDKSISNIQNTISNELLLCPTESTEQTTQHFLSAGSGSRACRDQ